MSNRDPNRRAERIGLPENPASEEPATDVVELVIRGAPPWMISMVLHLVLMLILALVYFTDVIAVPVEVEVAYAELEGKQLIDDSLMLSTLDPLTLSEPAYAEDLLAIENPLAAPPELEISFDAAESMSQLETPSIGLALDGRDKGAKRALLAAYGGTATTEAAVQLGLEWLKRKQRRDGSWSLEGPFSHGVDSIPNPTAATAMALLAFQGNGQTHVDGDFKDVVKRGMQALLKMQDKDGNFFATGPSHHRLYSQAQATISICELYGMTQDSKLQEPAQRALNYAAKIQADDGRGGGGWRYQPGQDVDTSVTGWFVMAFQSARMSGLDVSSPTLDKVSAYLDHATDDGARYGYRPDEGVRPSMTAEALLCRQYLGWQRGDPRLIEGVEYIGEHPILWTEMDVYYWYYATQVVHHMGGEYWDRWNEVMRQVLPENQVKIGAERGSWSPALDKYGSQGGRLYVTCFCIYMLEVYYRHLPIYQHTGL